MGGVDPVDPAFDRLLVAALHGRKLLDRPGNRRVNGDGERHGKGRVGRQTRPAEGEDIGHLFGRPSWRWHRCRRRAERRGKLHGELDRREASASLFDGELDGARHPGGYLGGRRLHVGVGGGGRHDDGTDGTTGGEPGHHGSPKRQPLPVDRRGG